MKINDLDKIDEFLNSLPDVKEEKVDKSTKKVKYEDALKQVAETHKIVLCPECLNDCVCYGKKIMSLGSPIKTDWYGILKYYKCKCCKVKLVSQDDGELEVAAIQ